MDREDIANNVFNISKKLTDSMVKIFERDYSLTEEQAIRITFLITQLKQGYTLTIYDDNKSIFESSLCTIYLIPKEKYIGFDDIEFQISIEEISQLQFKKPHTNKIKFKEFINIVFEYSKTRDMSLHYDIDWREEDGI